MLNKMMGLHLYYGLQLIITPPVVLSFISTVLKTVEALLKHPDIDATATNNKGETALGNLQNTLDHLSALPMKVIDHYGGREEVAKIQSVIKETMIKISQSIEAKSAPSIRSM